MPPSHPLSATDHCTGTPAPGISCPRDLRPMETTPAPAAGLRDDGAFSVASMSATGRSGSRAQKRGADLGNKGFALKNPNLPMNLLAPSEAHNRLVSRWSSQSTESTLMATINISLAFGSELINVSDKLAYWWLKPLFITLSLAAFTANVETASAVTQLTADLGRVDDARMAQCITEYFLRTIHMSSKSFRLLLFLGPFMTRTYCGAGTGTGLWDWTSLLSRPECSHMSRYSLRSRPSNRNYSGEYA